LLCRRAERKREEEGEVKEREGREGETERRERRPSFVLESGRDILSREGDTKGSHEST
jgi:hypothetical protein